VLFWGGGVFNSLPPKKYNNRSLREVSGEVSVIIF